MVIFNSLCNKQKPLCFFQFISIICACLVPLLITGPFLPDLIISLLSIFFLYYTFKKKIYKIYFNYYFLFFIAFCLICILSSILSENILFSLKSSLFYFRIGIFSLLIGYLINEHKKILDYFYFSFLITFSVLIIDGFLQYFTGFNLIGISKGGERISSFFGDEYIMGSYLVRLFPLCAALFFVRLNKKLWEYYFFLFFSIMVAILIYMAGERSSLFFLILFSLFLLLCLPKYRNIILIIIGISFLIIFVLMANNEQVKKRYIDSPIQSMGLNNSEKIFFTPQHDSLIRTAWNMFIDKPILGHGPRLYRLKCKDPKYAKGITPCHPHPHNFYIQLLAETGIIGFLFLAGFFFYFSYLILKLLYYYFLDNKIIFSNYQICLLGGLLITIWPITTNGNFFTNNLMILYSLEMGFFLKR